MKRNRRSINTAAILAGCAILVAGSTALANHGGLDGRLEVINERAQPVLVEMDGQRLGKVAPGDARTFVGIANGVRLVSITGPQGSPLFRQVDIPIGGAAALRIEPLYGEALIINRSGVPMRVAIDGVALGIVPDGGRLRTPRLPVGPARVVASPAGRWASADAPIEERTRIATDRVARVRLDPWLARIRVHNPFPRRVALFVDGRRVGRLGAGRTRVLDELAPGVYEISLRRGHRILASSRVPVAAGRVAAWAPEHRGPAGLEIFNATGRRLTVRIGKQTLGRLAPGERRVFTDIAPGRHTLVAHLHGGYVLREDVRVPRSDTARVTFALSAHGPERPMRPRPHGHLLSFGPTGVQVAWGF